MLAAKSASEVSSPLRRALTLLISLIVVALVLLLAFRGDRRRALVPLVPITLASGWSALVLYAVRVPLNPMSVTLGALVIAISTEFGVLLSERHRQERLAGHDTIEALRRSYRQTGAAIAASGVTAIAGFGVLALSDIRMLRDFGFVTLIDLTVSLLGVLVALPAALVLFGEAPAREGRGRAVALHEDAPREPFMSPSERDARGAGDARTRAHAALRPLRRAARARAARLITINTIETKPNGLKGLAPGEQMPPFAVPLASGSLKGDADTARDADEGSAGRVPACNERGPQILNICQLYEGAPVVLALFVDGGSCPDVLSDMQALAPSFPGVRFAAVAIKGERAKVRSLIARTR